MIYEREAASYVLTTSKLLAFFMLAFKKMEYSKRNIGGRPRKEEKREEQLAVMCTKSERAEIEEKAKNAQCSISEFLRNAGLLTEVRVKTIPGEILKLTGIMNHIAANLNQIARKRNLNDNLNAIDRATLNQLSRELQEITLNLKIFYS